MGRRMACGKQYTARSQSAFSTQIVDDMDLAVIPKWYWPVIGITGGLHQASWKDGAKRGNDHKADQNSRV